MGIFDWFLGKHGHDSPPLTKGVRDFLDGKKESLTSADIDPEGTARYENYQRAMALKEAGDLNGAAKLLHDSCISPSIYKGHYRELFKIWRGFNREDLKVGRYQPVIDRVIMMVKLDREMIEEMLRYWAIQQRRKLPIDYFDKDRNLRVSDAKALQTAAEALRQDDEQHLALELIQGFRKE
ncbi:MAG: hypothetical protein KF793_09115 [Nitrospira sp.]|nr:hypothetical protein [Nitrospira sp.]